MHDLFTSVTLQLLLALRRTRCTEQHTFDANHRFDDRLRIKLYQYQITDDHFIPIWIILITSNYLHAGGWNHLLHERLDSQLFYRQHLTFFSYYSLFSIL